MNYTSTITKTLRWDATMKKHMTDHTAVVEKTGFAGIGTRNGLASTTPRVGSEVGRSGIVQQLQNQIRDFETAGRNDNGDVVQHGCPAIDRLLPENGYPRGALVQWLTAGGCAADFLSLRVAQQACADGGALVVIDPHNQFFPPAAAAIGINLDNLIVLRRYSKEAHTRTGVNWGSHTTSTSHRSDGISSSASATENDLLWAVDQSLRCSAVAAVWGQLDEIDERWFRRFQLSAESSGCVGLFLQPLVAARQPSWAEVQWLVTPGVNSVGRKQPSGRSVRQIAAAKTYSHNNNRLQPNQSSQKSNEKSREESSDPSNRGQAVRLQLSRCRGTHTGKSVNLNIDPVTGKIQRQRELTSPYRRTSTRNLSRNNSAKAG